MNKTIKHTISICLGSSCFVNGNHTLLKQVQLFIEQNHLGEYVDLKGSLCQNNCKNGPSITINDTTYTHLSEQLLSSILSKHLLNPSSITT
jgi:NADH:ubiquinone oxidoreductase subunit E